MKRNIFLSSAFLLFTACGQSEPTLEDLEKSYYLDFINQGMQVWLQGLYRLPEEKESTSVLDLARENLINQSWLSDISELTNCPNLEGLLIHSSKEGIYLSLKNEICLNGESNNLDEYSISSSDDNKTLLLKPLQN